MPKPTAIKISCSPDCPQEVDRLDLLVSEFTDRLRRQFADDIGRDPRAFKKGILRLIRRELPPRRGPSANLTKGIHKPRTEESVRSPQVNATTLLPPQHINLVAQSQDL